jgi:hypothetical protein
LTLILATNVSVGAVFAALLTTNHPTPYWWLASYGYSNNFETAANVIGTNGIPLWQSYIAGLNPLMASSQLRLSVRRDASTAAPVLNWNTATGRLYTLWWKTNVAETYTRLSGASNLAANVNTFTNLPASLKPRSFYRLEVSKP